MHKHTFRKSLIFFLASTLLAGCSFQRPISGGMAMLAGAPPALASNPNEVQLFLEPPKFSYASIALVTASASVAADSDIAATEADVIQKLKEQAALAGANGITNIVREFIAGDTNISGSSWGSVIKNRDSASSNDINLAQSQRSSSGLISNSYLLIYRGKAIKSN